MKAPTLALMMFIVIGTSEGIIDPSAIINLKTQIGNLIVNKASAVLQAKRNLILSGTNAVLSAKQNLIQRSLPHVVTFKTNKINSLLQLKKNLLNTAASHIGQIHISSGGVSSEGVSGEVPHNSPPLASETPLPSLSAAAVPSVQPTANLPPPPTPALVEHHPLQSDLTPPALPALGDSTPQAPSTSYGAPPTSASSAPNIPPSFGTSSRPPSPAPPQQVYGPPGGHYRPPSAIMYSPLPYRPASSYGVPPYH